MLYNVWVTFSCVPLKREVWTHFWSVRLLTVKTRRFILILKSLLHSDVSRCNHTTYQFKHFSVLNISVWIYSLLKIKCLNIAFSPLSLHCIILEFCCAWEMLSLLHFYLFLFFLLDQIWPSRNKTFVKHFLIEKWDWWV